MKKFNFKDPILYVRIGLALFFLVNGLSAFFSGEEIQGLIDGSFISHILPISAVTLTFLVGIHDTLMCLLIIFLRKYQKYLFAWAMIWIVMVISILGDPFDILEHVGIFSIAFGLWMNSSHKIA